MMKFKKFLAAAMTGAMMFGLVTTAAPAVSVYAADEKSAYTIDVDYENFTATIKGGENQTDIYVILEVVKDATASKVVSTHVYPVAEFTKGESKFWGVEVDLSFLKATKEAFIRVHGDSESVASDVVTINPQPKKVAVKYTSGQESLEKAFLINKAAATADTLAAYEYRSLYGSNYADLDTLAKDTVEVAGTTIVVRTKAVTGETDATKNAPAGVEVKVKIAAAAKAPKVTVDYANGNIKLPKNTQAQVIYTKESKLAATEWKDLSITAGDQKAILTLFDDTKEDVEALTLSGFTLAVRTKATDKKAASNPAIVTIKGAEKAVQTPGTEEGSLLEEVKVGEATLTWKVTENDVTYTAKGADFQYLKEGKWVTIKTTKSLVIKGGTSADQKLTVRRAGDKATNLLPSTELEVTIKAYVAPSTGGSGDGEDSKETE